MKRTICALLALALLLCLPAPTCAAAEVFGAPTVTLLNEQRSADDKTLTFSIENADAVGYEKQRKDVYDRLREKYGSDELAAAALTAAGQEAMLYPVVWLVQVVTADGAADAGAFAVTDAAITVTMCGDVLPALVAAGRYTAEAFSFTLRFFAALDMDGACSPLSPAAESKVFQCPASAHIAYNELPEGAENDNPSFLLQPFGARALKNPVCTGYTFAGWYDKGSGSYVNTIPETARDMALTARWTPRVYRVNYVLTTRPGDFIHVNNADNPQTHTFGTTVELLSPKAPYGYKFTGWYETADFTGEPVTVLAADRAGDVILYARWQTPEEIKQEQTQDTAWGDLDDDGHITAADARIALRVAVELETLPDELKRRADFTGTGTFTAATARQLLRLAVGLDAVEDVLRFYGLA